MREHAECFRNIRRANIARQSDTIMPSVYGLIEGVWVAITLAFASGESLFFRQPFALIELCR
jgi:hypothetical protein